ncbi:MAG: hypothetical protein QME96_07510 [Myxococcota bacterium]|nr:hypothetical protein [Myxococcota bacterium]
MKDALLGYNTNVVRLGRILHIQTEDSGAGRPHVLTHVFSEGTILASRKTEYAHIVGTPDMADQVKGMMKAQHKAMLLEVRDGVHDDAISRIALPEASGGIPSGVAAAARGELAPPVGLKPANVGTARSGFGRDLISDRSLDDVILSYLAEELTRDRK